VLKELAERPGVPRRRGGYRSLLRRVLVGVHVEVLVEVSVGLLAVSIAA
jgi:hypothetical protein